MKRIKKFLNKTAFIWIFFILSLVLTWYLFIYTDWIKEVDQKLTFILGSIAVAFSIFQFLISDQKERQRYINQIRIEEYRSIRNVIQNFIDSINSGLTMIDSLVVTENRLLNLRNELSILINSNMIRVFPDLKENDSSKKLEELTAKVLMTTSKVRVKYQKIENNELPGAKNMEKVSLEILNMEWGHAIKDDLFEIMKERTILLDYLQSTLGI